MFNTLRRQFFLLIIVATVSQWALAVESADTVIFDNAHSEVPYRIPAIACNIDGDLIAVADYRYSKNDIGMVPYGRLDLRYRVRDHSTGEWGDTLTLVAAHGEGDDFVAYGDPCIVADMNSRRVMVTSCNGNVSFPKGTRENHQGWSRFISNDGGLTWSEPTELSQQVFDVLDKCSDAEIVCFFIGSGRILQSPTVKTGDTNRLYCAAVAKTADKMIRNYVFFSDDFGETWKLLGDVDDCPIPQWANEPKVEELPDGNILISSRMPGGRKYNVFHFTDVEKGEGYWDKPIISKSEDGGVKASKNGCNGEVLVVPVVDTDRGTDTYLLLQSVPFGPEDRSHVGINYKVLADESDYSSSEALATGWDGIYEVTPETSAYSTMVLDANGDVAFLWEDTLYNHGYDIKFRTIPVSTITEGKYRIRK